MRALTTLMEGISPLPEFLRKKWKNKKEGDPEKLGVVVAVGV